VGDAQAGLLPGQGGARHVARRDHQRELPGDLAVVDRQRPAQGEGDRHDVARHQVADRHREYAGAILFGQRGPMAGGDRGLVGVAGGAALVELTLDHAIAGGHAEALDRGAIGQREHVGRLERRGVVVHEHLPDLGGHRQPHHADVEVDRGQGQPAERGVERAPAAIAADVVQGGFNRDRDHRGTPR
jgi:hypothetical protein